jgi:hypothetical protein
MRCGQITKPASTARLVSLPALPAAYFGAGFGALRAYLSDRTRKSGPEQPVSSRHRGSASFLKAMVKRK